MTWWRKLFVWCLSEDFSVLLTIFNGLVFMTRNVLSIMLCSYSYWTVNFICRKHWNLGRSFSQNTVENVEIRSNLFFTETASAFRPPLAWTQTHVIYWNISYRVLLKLYILLIVIFLAWLLCYLHFRLIIISD